MMVRKPLIGLLLILTLVLAACGGAAQAPNAPSDAGAMTEEAPMPEPTSDDMMDDDAMAEETPMPEPTADDMMSEETPMAEPTADDMMDDEVMSEETPMAEPTSDMMDDDAMSEETPMPESTSEAMMNAPAWFSAALTDVNTGQTFSLADFQGQIVLVETMAIWCPTCLAQQRQVQALRAALGPRDDLAFVVLDVDPNEDAASLQAYAAQHGFDWTYTVAPPEVAREIGRLYGDQFLNPSAAPMFIVDRHGDVHPLPFGLKNAETLESALQPFLDDAM